jgi:hypothetical protein
LSSINQFNGNDLYRDIREFVPQSKTKCIVWSLKSDELCADGGCLCRLDAVGR